MESSTMQPASETQKMQNLHMWPWGAAEADKAVPSTSSTASSTKRKSSEKKKGGGLVKKSRSATPPPPLTQPPQQEESASDYEEEEDPYTGLIQDDIDELTMHTIRSARPTLSKVGVEKVVVEDGAPNTHYTIGVIIHIDGATYALPIPLLQKMNKYVYDDGRIVYTPYQFWKNAGALVYDMSLSDKERKCIQTKTGLGLGQSVPHPCPKESRQTIVNVRDSLID